MRYLFLGALGLFGCGTSAIEGTDASIDSSLTDSPSPKDQNVADSKTDSAALDAGVDAPVDSGVDAIADTGSAADGGCSAASDCRLFSSYCSTAACQCLPLKKSAPDPVCGGGTVTCLINPCQAKVAVCSDAGTCAVGP